MENRKQRRGRPRIHASNATRQKKYRERRKSTRPPRSADPLEWNKYLVLLGLSISSGMFLIQAPAGCGLPYSGGNDGANIDLLFAKQSGQGPCGGGRRVKPTGSAPMDRDGELTGSFSSQDPIWILQNEILLLDAEEDERRRNYERVTKLKVGTALSTVVSEG
jgi:hypothetical protein